MVQGMRAPWRLQPKFKHEASSSPGHFGLGPAFVRKGGSTYQPQRSSPRRQRTATDLEKSFSTLRRNSQGQEDTIDDKFADALNMPRDPAQFTDKPPEVKPQADIPTLETARASEQNTFSRIQSEVEQPKQFTKGRKVKATKNFGTTTRTATTDGIIALTVTMTTIATRQHSLTSDEDDAGAENPTTK